MTTDSPLSGCSPLRAWAGVLRAGGSSDSFECWIEDSIKAKRFEDHYVLGKEIGTGATSLVCECRHRATGEYWAVKIIHKQVDKKVVKAECGVLLKIQHKHIIRLKDIYETVNQIYIVLELVTGGELFDRIVARGFYGERDAAKCVEEMLQAIECLHENGIVHRDLKPENLLYENKKEDSPLKVADFGLAKMLSPEVLMKTVCGTPGYCAPEILQGKAYGAAVDMWNTGVIVYILLCGYEPFYADMEEEMVIKIIKCDYEFHEPWWDNISAEAKDFIRRLLVTDPTMRLTASEALAHPWVKDVDARVHLLLGTAQSRLRHFNARRRLRAATDCVIMMNKVYQSGGRKSQSEVMTKAISADSPAND